MKKIFYAVLFVLLLAGLPSSLVLPGNLSATSVTLSRKWSWITTRRLSFVIAKSCSKNGKEGKDISKATLEVLKKYGYTTKDSNVYFQTFDFPDLVYVREKLMPEMDMDLKTVMLFAGEICKQPISPCLI